MFLRVRQAAMAQAPAAPAAHGRVATAQGAALRQVAKAEGGERRADRALPSRVPGRGDGGTARAGPALAPWPRPLRAAAHSGERRAGRRSRCGADAVGHLSQGGGRSARGGAAGAGAIGSRAAPAAGLAMARAAQVSAARRLHRPPPSAGAARPTPSARTPVPAPRPALAARDPALLPPPDPTRARRGRASGQSRPSLILGSPSSRQLPRPGRARPPPPPPAGHCEVRAGGRVGEPGETPGAAAVASSCRRHHRRPLHRLPCSDLAGKGERCSLGPSSGTAPRKGLIFHLATSPTGSQDQTSLDLFWVK